MQSGGNNPLYIAVDLGAGSGRVFVVGMSPSELLLEEVHRFQYAPLSGNGHVRWDSKRIWNEVQTGLQKSGQHARELERPVASVGVDSWGTDYALLDTQGKLCEDPVCYRDSRTENAMEKVFERISRDEIFSRTGIQFLSFNTLFQLHAHAEEGLPQNASRLLLIPDLMHYLLSGRAASEYTNATTTQMLNAQTHGWDDEL